MAKIDFDGIKTKLKRNARPMLAGITVGPSVTYRLHGGTTKKKRKSKKRRRHPHSGYLGAWCPWWAPYDTEHGQHDPKFDPVKPTPVPDAPADIGGETVGGGDAGGAAAGGVSGGAAIGGGMVGESNGVSGEAWNDYDINDLAVISKTSPMEYARLSCNRLGLTEEQTNDLLVAISEEKSLFFDAISPMGGIALEGSPEAEKLRKRGDDGLYARGMIWNPDTKEVSGIFVGRGKEEPGCWWDNFAIFTGSATLDGVVIGESADNGLFFESVDEAVGFMVSSKMVEVPPESASDTMKMLRNGVADAISCYTPQLPKRHPFKVFKVCDVPTKEVKQINEWHSNGKLLHRNANIYESISREDVDAARDSNDLSVNGFWDCEDDDDMRIKENMFDEAVGFVDSLPSKIPVYRAISLHGEKFDSEMPGTSWSKYPESAIAFGGHNGSDTLIIGEVDKADCDIPSMIVNYCLFSGSYDEDDENEIVVNDYGAPVRISRIIPMSEAKKEFSRKK